MGNVRFTRTPEQQIDTLRSRLQQLERMMPVAASRPSIERRSLLRMAQDTLDDLEANLKHIDEHGTLKEFGGG